MSKAEQCQQLLLDNERDTLNAPRYKCAAVRMGALQDLRMEREALLDELERLTGKREFRVDEIAQTTPRQDPPAGDGPTEKEPVLV